MTPTLTASVGIGPSIDQVYLLAARALPNDGDPRKTGGTFGGTAPDLSSSLWPFVFGIWSRRPDSNRRPAVYKTAALPAELRRRAHRLYEGLASEEAGFVVYEVATVV